MEQGGWLDMRSVLGYTHDVPSRRRALVGRMLAPQSPLDTMLDTRLLDTHKKSNQH